MNLLLRKPLLLAPSFLVLSVLANIGISPAVVHAQVGGGAGCAAGQPGCGGGSTSIPAVINVILGIFSALIPLLIGIAVALFLYGVLKYVMVGDDESGRRDAVGYMIWGIVSIFVMISIWGLVGILNGTFGTIGASVPPVPQSATN